MPANRFFIKETLHKKDFSLTGEEAHHLLKVMRGKVGEHVELVNGQGELVQTEIVSSDKNRVQLRKISYHREPAVSYALVLAQALTKSISLDWIIEKATELGVTHFWLFPGNRSEKKSLSSQHLNRLKCLSIQALKQCGRLFLPSIEMKSSLDSWEKPQGSFFYGDLQSKNCYLTAPFSHTTIFLIGPEKGLDEDERQILNTLCAKPVCFHPNTLRAETAAIVAISQFSLLHQKMIDL